MTLPKTRCNQCFNSDKKATQEPCNKCNEKQFGKKGFDNNFLDASRNLMKED